MIVWCDCVDCIHNDDGLCTQQAINIGESFYEDAPAKCDDYQEGEE